MIPGMTIDWSEPNQKRPHPRPRSQSHSSGIRGLWSSFTGAFNNGSHDGPADSGHHHHHHHHHERSSSTRHTSSSNRSRPPTSRSSSSKPTTYVTNAHPGNTVIVVHHRRPSAQRVQVIQAAPAPAPAPRRQQTAPAHYYSSPPTPSRRPSHHSHRMPSGNRTEGGTKVLTDAQLVEEYMTSQSSVQKWLQRQAATGH